MGGSSKFDLIVQEVAKQQQLMDALIQENRQLHQQLDDFRAGKTIQVEILGTRFSLAAGSTGSMPTTTKVDTQTDTTTEAGQQPVQAGETQVAGQSADEGQKRVPMRTVVVKPETEQQPTRVSAVTEQPTRGVPVATERPAEEKPTAPSEERQAPQPVAEHPATEHPVAAKSSFLEEMMLNEFNSALASTLPLPQTPQNTAPATPEKKESVADQHAELRRQLVNSYILE